MSDASQRLAASRRRFRERQGAARNLDDFVQALLIHVNEAAAALRHPADPPRGRVFRVGLATVGEDGLVAPIPFRRSAPASLFIDQFHVMPLRATSLGPLLERGRGDRIDDLEAHLAARGVSLSSQVALREGVLSNVRLPWHSLDRRGFLWFSADTPRFFDDALFEVLEALVPDVELQLRLLDMLEPLLPAGPRPRPLESSGEGLERLRDLLESEANPLPGQLELAWSRPAEGGARLVDLWKAGPGRVLLCALECEGEGEAARRLLLTLRGWVLQKAGQARNPARMLEAVEEALRGAARAGALPRPAVARSLSLALLHLDPLRPGHGHLDLAGAGEGRLWMDAGGGVRRILADSPPPGEGNGREARVEALEPGRALLVEQGGRPPERAMPLQVRLRLGLKGA